MNTPQPIQTANYAASPLQFDPGTTIIRMPDLAAITGLARPTIYKRLKDDPTFPRPVQLSDSKARGAPVGFVLAEVQEWVRKRIALREVAWVSQTTRANTPACNTTLHAYLTHEE